MESSNSRKPDDQQLSKFEVYPTLTQPGVIKMIVSCSELLRASNVLLLLFKDIARHICEDLRLPRTRNEIVCPMTVLIYLPSITNTSKHGKSCSAMPEV